MIQPFLYYDMLSISFTKMLIKVMVTYTCVSLIQKFEKSKSKFLTDSLVLPPFNYLITWKIAVLDGVVDFMLVVF